MRDVLDIWSHVPLLTGNLYALPMQAKATWHSSCHRLRRLSVRREVQRSMISLSFRGAILLTRRRLAEEVDINKINRPNRTPTVCTFAVYLTSARILSRLKSFNRSFSRDIITLQNLKLKDPSKFLSSSGVRGGIFISINNFTAS